MRDKYIELIINYIKEKPEFENTLDAIKKEVVALGASESEFDEAVNRITNTVGGPMHTISNVPTDFIMQNTVQPEIKTGNKQKLIDNAYKLGRLAKEIGGSKKKYIAIISFILITLISVTQIFNFLNKPTVDNSAVAREEKTKISKINKSLIPVVYASSHQIDSDMVFSIKSPNAQLTVTGKPKKEVLGFFPYWMLSKYDQITLNTLTSISLFGLDIDGKGGILRKDANGEPNKGWEMWTDPNLDKLIQKAKSYDIKVYLTIKSFNNTATENMVASDEAQKYLISNILYLVNSKNLNGVNIDFEYIGNPSDKTRDGFTRFITNLNAELKRQDANSSLTIDTYLVSGSDSGIFNIPVLAINCDAFVIMGYDMHTPSGGAGPVAAMGGDTNVIGYVQNYLEKISPEKIILAVPYYGYDWPKNPNSGLPVKVLPYAQVAVANQNAKLTWDETSQTPSFSYMENGQERIVHFDNVRSLAIKYDFINRKNLKGLGIWALGYDGQNQDLEKLIIDKFINQ